MTNRQLISRIKNTLKEHRADSVLTNKHVYNILQTSASLLIKRDADQNKSLFKLSNIWSSLCITMKKVPNNTCCIPIPISCEVWRSENKLPAFLETSSGFLTKSISTPDGSIDIKLVTPRTYQVKSKIKSKQVFGFLEDGYLYLPGKGYPYIKIVGYFKDIVQSNCGEEPVTNCSFLDKEFPCPDYLVQAVVDLTLRELSTFKQLPFDHVSNKNENVQVI